MFTFKYDKYIRLFSVSFFLFEGSCIWRPSEAAARRVSNVKRTAGICSETVGNYVYEIPTAQRKV